jgi:hypothetical protein
VVTVGDSYPVEGVKKGTHPVRGGMFIEVGVRGASPRQGCNVLFPFREARDSERISPIWKYDIAPLPGCGPPITSPSINIPPLAGWMRKILSHLRRDTTNRLSPRKSLGSYRILTQSLGWWDSG